MYTYINVHVRLLLMKPPVFIPKEMYTYINVHVHLLLMKPPVFMKCTRT